MKRSRFSEEQIIAILHEQEAGAKTAEICRKHGVSGATFYKWKARYGGMDVSDARRLRALEDENARLKKLRRLHAEERLQMRRRGGRKWALAVKMTRIGQFLPGPPDVRVVDATGREMTLARGGWSHFD